MRKMNKNKSFQLHHGLLKNVLPLHNIFNEIISENIQQRKTFPGTENGLPFYNSAFYDLFEVNCVVPFESNNDFLQYVDCGFRKKKSRNCLDSFLATSAGRKPAKDTSNAKAQKYVVKSSSTSMKERLFSMGKWNLMSS